MTVLQYLKRHLIFTGLVPRHADEVIVHVIQDPSNQHMRGRWEIDEREFRPTLQVLTESANKHAVEWIDSHLPHHHARWKFAGTPEPKSEGKKQGGPR